MTPVGVGLVGVGMWGRRMAAAAERAGGVDLVTCFARDEGARSEAAETLGRRGADSLDSLLDDSDVEAVMVVTLNHTHAEIAVAAAERGRHVFVEKPFADRLADGLRAAEASERAHMAAAAEIDDVAVALLEHASGARSVISCSYVSPKTYRIRVYGTRANLDYRTEMSIWPEAERMDEATTLTIEDATGSVDLPFEPCDMLVDELEEFARCIRTGAAPETGAWEGLAALSVIEGVVETAASGGIRSSGERRENVPKIVPGPAMRSEADGLGSVRARLIDRIAVGGMTLERITLEPGARGPAIVGEAAERFLCVIRGAGSAGDLPLASETMVWIRPGDRLRLLAGDEGLEVLVAGADAPADP